MSINKYEKDGKTFYTVYRNVLGKDNRRLRIQKRINEIETYKEALRIEKKLISELAIKMEKLEGRGLFWDEIIDRWVVSAKNGLLGDKASQEAYIKDHQYRLKYTKRWKNKVAADINKADARKLLNDVKESGLSLSMQRKIKGSIGLIYKWGMEEGFIPHNHNPVEGIQLHQKSEKVPKILTLDEVRKLLTEAKIRRHSWYHVWSFALLTGMRSGELLALRWPDIELDKGIIRVSRSMSQRIGGEKSTKSGYWRTVPISDELRSIIVELMQERGNKEFVLPRLTGWKSGFGGKILRIFLSEIGIEKDIVFHTLRACFATHLLASGAEAPKVMQIGGWKDFKTFQIYIRLAGVSVKGVTDSLNLLPDINLANVVNLRNH